MTMKGVFSAFLVGLVLSQGLALPQLPPPHASSHDVTKLPPEALAVDVFARQTRKHARPMFYINCGYRDLCYCYSKITRHHYCCSCDVGACFPAHARVTTPTGSTTTMERLKTGDQVLAVDESGNIVSTAILGFMDRRSQENALYVTLHTSIGQNLTLSPNHVLFKSVSNSSQPISVFGSDINIGDVIFSANQTGLHRTEIVAIDHEISQGAYVPLTMEGTLVVEGTLVSCYASYKHSLAHSFLAPARTFPMLLYLRPGITSTMISLVKDLTASTLKKWVAILHEVAGSAMYLAGGCRSPEMHEKGHGTEPEENFEGIFPGNGGVADGEGEGEAYFISLVKLVGWLLYKKERAVPQVLQVMTVPEEGLLLGLRLPQFIPQMTSTILGLLSRSW
ncbi:indian hedgehog protein isoform X1 [Procambarus clarkii]|uniref:indian hedgehog protein isoform X1 n=1 Tax=Procambarus clarkii TaxID=6728 RepID=UPI003742F978